MSSNGKSIKKPLILFTHIMNNILTEMIKKVFLLFLLPSILALNVYSQEINQTDSKGQKQGSWKKYYPSNDQLFYEGQFKDDQPYGEFKHYYEEGQLKSTTLYDDEKVRSEVFYSNGNRMAIGYFIDQKKDSIWTYYDKAGWVSMREEYKKGMKSGFSISYYPDASIASKQQFKDDVETGESIQYYPNGKLESKGNYLGGSFNGDYTYYYESGKKMHSGEYISGKRNGMWLFFNENGSLRTVIQYRMGEIAKETPKNGEFVVYYENGLPKSIFNYTKGLKDGAFVEYYDKGEKVLVPREKKNSYEPDEFEEVIEGQQIKRKGVYSSGALIGEEFFYNEDGSMIEKISHN